MRYRNIEFLTGKSRKFDADLYRVIEILDKGILTAVDRAELIRIYQSSYHDDGKIEGITSCDSSCNGCGFCQNMLEAASKDITIICGFCYDEAQERYKIHARNRHSLNLLIMMTVEFTEEELKRIPMTDLGRVNSSGETPNVTYARNMIKVVYANPYTDFGYWAKNTSPVIQAIDELGKPDNLKLIQSSIHIGKPAKLAKHFDYTFTVYPDEATTEAAIRNGSSPCNGMKCKSCGFKCYKGTHTGTDIAELLRTSKAKRKVILEAMSF